MPITNVDGWSTTANLNSDVGGISIATGMSPSNIDNALREIMAQVAATPLAETAATMRTNLGVSATADTPTLVSLEGLSLVAGDILYATAADTLARLPKGTALQYLQQNSALTAPQWVTGREVLTATRTYYVRTDGSDSNTGLVNSAGGAFLTLQKAMDIVAGIDFAGYAVTVQVGNGTYTAGFTFPVTVGQLTVSGLTVRGDTTTPDNVIISTTSANCVALQSGARGYVEGFELRTTTSGGCIDARGVGAHLQFGAMRFGVCAGSHIAVGNGATVTNVSTNYTISGAAAIHWYSDTNGQIYIQSRTITISGTPAFSVAFAYAITGSVQPINGNTFSGAATGVRYTVNTNAVIFTNGGGATYLPGGTAGSTATGGQYV